MTAPDQNSGKRGEQQRIVMNVELAGYTKAFQTRDDEAVARFVDDYYQLCEQVLTKRGGNIVKFMGDGCLATFEADAAVDAVGAALDLERALDDLSQRHALPLLLGANIHLTSVIEGTFGTGQSAHQDIIGRGVNQTFLLGRGPGIRISEPVYRKLPNDARGPWHKHKPPAIYHLTATPPGVLQGLEKDAGTNTTRW